MFIWWLVPIAVALASMWPGLAQAMLASNQTMARLREREPLYPQPRHQLMPPRRTFWQTNVINDDPRMGGPPTTGNRPGDVPYIISQSRLADIRSRFLYWFFDRDVTGSGWGDYQTNIHPSSPQIHKNFNFQLPFFGFRFNYTRVSVNGYLEFSDPPDQLVYPLSFPIPGWPKVNDPSFIGIFYSKCRIGNIRPTDIDQRRPGVYFRMERDLRQRTDQFGVEMRERIKWDIREAMVGADNFNPKHAVIITWKNITFAGGIDPAKYKTNTFQMVLATDEVFGYAIFNYLDLQWTSHTEAGGDTTNGEGGVPAFVGFNAGNGTRSYEYRPFSQMLTIRDLTGRGFANGFPGRHIFRIDEKILTGTCNKDVAGATLPLMFAPESGNMLGGTIVNITGPCFEPDMKIVCKFDIVSVTGRVVDKNRAICVQPFLTAEGYILFDISINGDKFIWKGKYFIETPSTSTKRIFFSDPRHVHEKYPRQIQITWNKYNLTNNAASQVQLSVWGYRERTIRPELVYIDQIEAGVPNTGSYTIMPSSYKNRNNWDKLDLGYGFIQINLTAPIMFHGLDVTPLIWSQPIPLGWYFAPQWERKYGKRWPEPLCEKWLKDDRFLKNFASSLSQCPCTLEQAFVDKGQYFPDYDCDIDANPDCFYHQGARHCVKSGYPSMEGSEQQCCYDKNNYLMMSYDQMWGSTPKRSSNFGLLPWNEANKVPTLSQWYHDMTPFYYCCLWQEEQAIDCETFRFERRPSQDCVGYQAPYVGTVFGDPHFITFDSLDYTFNGMGEFVLVRSVHDKYELNIQARFEQVGPNIYGPVMGTKLTSIAAQDNSSTVIEVRMRPADAQWRYRMDVFADGERVYFDRPSFRVQKFRGVTVYQPSYVLNQSEIVLMFRSGIGVEIQENLGYMGARVYLPWTYINKTKGLLGNWSFNPADDFVLPDGSVASLNLNDFERIHKDFAMHWALDDGVNKYKGKSLFLHEYFRSASYYLNRTFTPVWKKNPQDIIPLNRSQDIATAEDICGDCYQCKYDYSISLSKKMAFMTLKYFTDYSTISRTVKERVITCGVLETPRFGRKSNFFFTPGTKVVFECNQDFVLTGDRRRECTAQGFWNFPPYGYTECLSYVEYDSRQLMKTGLIILAVLVPLLLIISCCAFHVYKRGNKRNLSWQYVIHRSGNDLAGRRRSGQSSGDITGNNGVKSSEESPGTSANETLPAGTTSGTGTRKRRRYDGVYLTNEPIPGAPPIDFIDDDCDLPLPSYSAANTMPKSSPPVSETLQKSSYPNAGSLQKVVYPDTGSLHKSSSLMNNSLHKSPASAPDRLLKSAHSLSTSTDIY